ncbi:uncharacterized protein [Engystomops pustulosus]|uniref:uncharacterized protein n=1 Tax=Engystomops pustulosus TaxID=76066 RepID=UPI003AFB1479
MENRAERSSEGEPLSSSQDIIIREISSTDVPVVSPGESTRAAEKKQHHTHSRSSVVPSSHHRSSQSQDRHSSSSVGALDLQSVVGRSGSSSISGITVPIRLDALSYLLNNAVLGAYKTPAQMPCYPPMYPPCAYTQMGYPYGACMNSPQCNMPFMNQFPVCQPGAMPFGTQQSVQTCQNPMPNFNQCMGVTTSNPNQAIFSGMQPQTGMLFSTSTMNATPTALDKSQTAQSDSSTWPQRASVGFGNNQGPSSSSNYEKQSSSPPQRGLVRFQDNQNEDRWSSRPQGSFSRGRGRGDFRGRPWQGNSNGTERRFGDRSWNMDSGGRRRFQESPERGNSFKRGRWQDSRGRDGDNRDSWQQRNKQGFSPPWVKAGTSQDRFKSNEEEKVAAKTDESNDQDEDWEMEYVGEPVDAKTTEQSPASPLPSSSKTCETPPNLTALEKSVDDNEDESKKGDATSLTQEKEEGEWDSSSDKTDKTNVEEMQIKPEVNNENPAQESYVVEKVEEVLNCVLSVDDNSGILVMVDP